MDEKAAEQAYVDAYWANHPVTRLGAATRALRADLLRPFEQLAGWLSKRL